MMHLKNKMEWQVKEDIVISGISGRFPESDNIDELKENLFKHVNMVTCDERRWPFDFHGIPNQMGKMKNLNKFDAHFFGIMPIQANLFDPQSRILLELTYEAIVDAGINPQCLRGTNTGVYIGVCTAETEEASLSDIDNITMHNLNGTGRSILANRLSYNFDFRGPSFSIDTACSSSLMALQQAIIGIQTNQCDQAIAGGANICIRPSTSAQFVNCSMLSSDGCCKHLDSSANGYVRSETCSVIFLQKKSEAKRIYATVVHAKTNTDGFKEDGISFPSWSSQKDLMQATVLEAGIDPNTVEYVEAHGTGTPVGDPVETKAIAAVFCKERKNPLLIGSIKSNLGHSEAASGMNSIAKMVIAFENNLIPANLHYKSPNLNIPELIEGFVTPVTENTPFKDGLVALNSFGIGGVNVSIILKTFAKKDEKDNKIVDNVPRMILVTGQTEDAMNYIMDFIENNPEKITNDFLALMQNFSKTNLNFGMNYRGYLFSNDCEAFYNRKIEPTSKSQRSVWFVYSGMGSQWISMAKGLMSLDLFRESIEKSANILKQVNIDLLDLLLSEDKSVLETTVAPFVAITATQIALTDVLKRLDISPDGIVGHSLGEIACGYCDGVLTQTQALLVSYWRGKCVEDAKVPKGLMAAVGLTIEEVIARAPKGIVPACHNAIDSLTISGPYDEMEKFVKELNSENIFARIVKTGDVAYHSYYMDPVSPALMRKMDQVIPIPSLRSSKWICSSVPENKWHENSAKYSSASYYVNNLVSRVLFFDAIQHVPKNAIVVEIAPHSLLQPIIKRNLGSEITYINLIKRNNNQENLNLLLNSIGKLYTLGLNPDISQFYPKVHYPVSRGTQSLSSLIKWDHSQDWHVPMYPEFFNPHRLYSVKINLEDSNSQFYSGHCIDGRILFPATGYLYLVWQMIAKIKSKPMETFPIQFEDIVLHRATIFPKNSTINFEICFIEATGEFCVSEGNNAVVTGKVFVHETSSLKFQHILKNELTEANDNEIILKTKDIYKELRLRGYDYGKTFKSIIQVNSDSKMAKIKYTNWVVFSDNMLQASILDKPGKALYLPVRFQSIKFDPQIFFDFIKEKQENGQSIVDIKTDSEVNVIVAPGLEIKGLKANLAPRRQTAQFTLLEKCIFSPYLDSSCILNRKLKRELREYIDATTSLAITFANCLENSTYMNILKNSTLNLNENDIKKYTDSNSEKYQIPKILKILNNQNLDLKKIIVENQDKLNNDLLATVCESQYFLRNIIDTVMENISSSTVNLAEVNCTSRILQEKVVNILNSFEYQINLKYQLHQIKSSTNDDDLKQSNLTLPFEKNSIDFLLFKDGNGFNILNDPIEYQNFCNCAYKVIKNGGFIAAIFRSQITPAENLLGQICGMKAGLNYADKFKTSALEGGFNLISERSDSLITTILLFRKTNINTQTTPRQAAIEITNTNYEWVELLKSKLLELQNKPIGENTWLLAKDSLSSGIIGLVKCLRKEVGGDRIRCILNTSNKYLDYLPETIFQNDLVFNVFRNEKIGAFRHYELEEDEINNRIETEFAYLNVESRGDLSSFKWFESSHKHIDVMSINSKSNNQVICSVYYASLNFRDIMLATGKLPPDALSSKLALQDCILGLEFVGRDLEGQRIMGMIPSKGLATTVLTEDTEFLWPVPSNWTMEDAASVPVVYLTAYYALIMRGKLEPGESILIHSGSGGVGQAAIEICLSMGCQVFTTVGNDEKRQYIKERFPLLSDKNIFNSRDISFEEHIMHETNGFGVDVVLNSLAEDKFQATVRCLALHGRFLEIGKYDMAQNSNLKMSTFLKNIEFHGVLLDALFESGNSSPKIISEKKRLGNLFIEGIKSGVVKPIKRTVFDIDQCEKAFRFMSTGKHIGKVVIKIRNEETQKVIVPSKLVVKAIQKTLFFPLKTYIVAGGLGGFGLEMINWLVERDAKNIIITSRTGLREPYQNLCIRRLKENGIKCIISNANISNMEETKQLIKEANELGPVGGIFNLALVLSDGFIENQTVQSFETVCAGKVSGTQNLDKLSRELCPHLDYFVAFSSVSCGRGNAGQTNYGFANSSMERVCEQRRLDGLHGLAIQWGVIGDVGVVVEKFENFNNNQVIGGTMPQRIPSCLSVLDKFLQSPEAVYSSVVPGKVTNESSDKKQDFMKKIANIFGIKDYRNVSPESTLAELGIDSLVAVEVKQILEQDLETNFSIQEIRLLTIQKLIDLSKNSDFKPNAQNKDPASVISKINHTESLIKFSKNKTFPKMFFIPPIEGNFDLLENIANDINGSSFGLNWTADLNNFNTIEEVSGYYVEQVKPLVADNHYILIGYSFGTAIAFDMALKLQANSNAKICLIFLDGSPNIMYQYLDSYTRLTKANDNQSKLTEALTNFITQNIPLNYDEVKKELLLTGDEQQQIKKAADILMKNGAPNTKQEDIELMIKNFIKKLVMLHNYQIKEKFIGDITLIRADKMYTKFSEDYGISQIITGKSLVHILPGNHKSFLENKEAIVSLINQFG